MVGPSRKAAIFLMKAAHPAGPGPSDLVVPVLTTCKADVKTEAPESFCIPENDRKAEQRAKGPWDTVT